MLISTPVLTGSWAAAIKMGGFKLGLPFLLCAVCLNYSDWSSPFRTADRLYVVGELLHCWTHGLEHARLSC